MSGFAITNTNYSKAVALLHERFGQKHKIIQTYMQALLDLPAPVNTITTLRCFYDKTEIYIRGFGIAWSNGKLVWSTADSLNTEEDTLGNTEKYG